MDTLNLDERLELSRLIMALLDDWQASAAQKIALLALPSATKPRAVKRYYTGTPLPDQTETNERIRHLVGIADALRTSYPLNPNMGRFWMNRRNRRFGDRTPLATMVEDGLDGVIAVRAHLDCAFDWELDADA